MGDNSQSGLLTFLPLLLPLLLIAWMVYAGRRRQAAVTSFQSQLGTGERVCTTSGLYGTVRALTDSTVDLEVAPGVVLRFDRRAIAMVVPDEADLRASATPSVDLDKDADLTDEADLVDEVDVDDDTDQGH